MIAFLLAAATSLAADNNGALAEMGSNGSLRFLPSFAAIH
jgi:hypothetical protein